jgi:hypothetical protein
VPGNFLFRGLIYNGGYYMCKNIATIIIIVGGTLLLKIINYLTNSLLISLSLGVSILLLIENLFLFILYNKNEKKYAKIFTSLFGFIGLVILIFVQIDNVFLSISLSLVIALFYFGFIICLNVSGRRSSV